ncbi:hypothetical protein [Rhodobacter lacus]
MADGAPHRCAPPQPQRLVEARPCALCGGPCAPGLAFLRHLARALDAVAASGALPEDFEISGKAELRCADRLCPVIWHAGQSFCRVESAETPAVPVVLETRAQALN